MPDRPTYRAPRNRYEIDRCEQQRSAVNSGKIDFHALSKGHYPGKQIPRKILPGLSSIGFWNAESPQDWGLDEHRNEGIEITFLETGSTTLSVDNINHQMQAGDFTITRPWQLHRLGVPNIGPGRLHWLILDVGVRRPHQAWQWPKWIVLAPEDLEAITRKLRRSDNPLWRATPAIAQSFRELARNVCKWDEPHSVSRITANLNQLLVGILDVLGSQPNQENNQLISRRQTVRMFLDDLHHGRLNPGEAWTLGKMASQCDMGVTAFTLHCRAIVNCSPVSYLNNCRLEKAANLLQSKNFNSITEVALACGFNSSQYFATHFRRKFKKTPTEYKFTSQKQHAKNR